MENPIKWLIYLIYLFSQDMSWSPTLLLHKISVDFQGGMATRHYFSAASRCFPEAAAIASLEAGQTHYEVEGKGG